MLTKLIEGNPTNIQIWTPICICLLQLLTIEHQVVWKTDSFIPKNLACRVRKASVLSIPPSMPHCRFIEHFVFIYLIMILMIVYASTSYTHIHT